LISQTATQTAVFAWFFSMPLFLANIWGWSTIETGLAMAVPMLFSFNSVLAGRYADRHGYRMVLSTGGLIAAAGLGWWMIALDNEPSYLALAVGLVVFGWGSGQVGVIGMGAALNSLNDDLLAEGNAALQTNRRLVQGLGAATALAILGNRDASSFAAFRWAWAFAAGGYLISAIVMWWYPADEKQPTSK
jgi:MFS family permease